MQRGDIWTLQDKHYASKARPVVILQSALVEECESVVLALLTSFDREPGLSRVKVDPSPINGLTRTSYVMVEKLFTVPKADLGIHVGVLTSAEMRAVSRKLTELLSITVEDLSSRT